MKLPNVTVAKSGKATKLKFFLLWNMPYGVGVRSVVLDPQVILELYLIGTFIN